MKQVKVLKINQTNIKNSEIVNLTDENIVKIGTYNFLFKALEIYKKSQFEDGEKVTEFIKIMLPKYEKDAHEQWFNGVTWEGKLYKAWFSTVGGMKQEDKKSKSKCEVIFVNEEIADFKGWFEDVISLGKFSKIDKTKDMYVNKKVLSRFSLATSDLITEIDMPDIIILPQARLPWKKTYKTVEPKDATYTTKNGKEKQCVDYDLVDYNFDNEFDIFDGGGIATPKVMDAVGSTLCRRDIDFAIIRGFGSAIKGMITRFNIIGYLDVMYPKTGDTDYCKKNNDGNYELLDMYKKWRVVTDNTLLLNESMVKLADMFENMDEYTTLLEKCNTEQFNDIYNLLNKLYITKVNKKNEELKQYRKMNYQIMSALALTTNEYNTLAAQDFKLFKKLLKPFEKGTHESEFITNVDYINLFYDQCCEGEETEEDDLKEITNVVDKSNVLIKINQENVKLSYVKKNLAKLIEKKVRDMAQGKITLKATYNYIAIDPISYINFAMTRELGDNGLAIDEFYCRACKNGEIRTVFRNPLMAYSEVHNITFKSNIFLDTWLCKSEEIVYFNDKSDILSLMGSADKDGDSCTMVDNGIVKNAVVVPKDGKYFCFTADGNKKPCKFDNEGRFLATYTPSGNLIGQVAIMGASVNNNNQGLKLYISKSNKFYSWEEITNKLIKKNLVDLEGKSDDEKYEILKDFVKTELIEKEFLDYSNNADSEILREQIKQQFYNNEKDIYALLYVSSLVIDSPKTMNTINVDQYTNLIKQKYPHKANFLQYAKRLDEVNEKDYAYSINSTLDNFGDRVQLELLNNIAKRKKDFSDQADLLQEQLINDKFTRENVEKALDEINSLYNSYKIELAKNKSNLYKADKVISRKLAEHHVTYENVSSKWEDIEWQNDKQKIFNEYRVNKKNYYKELDKIDAEFLPKANEIIANNDIYSVAIALSKLDKVSERFIINFFMSALISVDKVNPSLKYKYPKCNGDEVDAIKYMYEYYKREERKVNLSDAVIEKLAVNDLVRYHQAAKVRFRNEDTQLIESIENGLATNKYYDLDITNLEAFDEYKRVVEGKETVRIKGFMLKQDCKKDISKKSFGVCIEL